MGPTPVFAWFFLILLGLVLAAGGLLVVRGGARGAIAAGFLVGLLIVALYFARAGGLLPAVALLVIVLAFGGSALFTRPRTSRAIPRAEIATLGTTIAEADRLAADGQAQAGYAHLADGLQRAEGARRQGLPWGGELAGRWKEVVEEFAREYRVGPTYELAPAMHPPGRGDELAPPSA